MNTYNIFDKNFLSSDLYKRFIEQNSALGSLKVRAYAASEAIPISGLKIVISTIFEDNKIIFFEGFTNESGLIEKIKLPAPKLLDTNLDVPKRVVYDIEATIDNISLSYKVNMYEDVCVVQNISIVPDLKVGVF